MMEDMRQHVDISSEEFKEGVEAGLDSAEDTKNRQAGHELGQELKDGEKKEPVSESFFKEPVPPVF